MRRCCVPVSPIVFPLIVPTLPQTPGGKVAGGEVASLDDGVHDLRGVVVLGEPIVGTEVVTLDGRGPGALPATPLPAPKEPTPAQRERHNVKHVPCEEWCPYCVACRRPIRQHRLKGPDCEMQPLLSGEYDFVCNTGDDQLVPVLVVRLKPLWRIPCMRGSLQGCS